MRDRDAAALAALMVLLVSGRRRVAGSPESSGGPVVPPGGWGEGWHWPVPDLALRDASGAEMIYPATISQEFRPGAHVGVDIMYQRSAFHTAGAVKGSEIDAQLARLLTPNADAKGITATSGPYFAPPNTPIAAAHEGIVWSVARTARGIEIVLDHGKPWATYYAHLASARWAVGSIARGKAKDGSEVRVQAGEYLGLMGGDPSIAAKLRHLHFEAWYKGAGNAAAVDLGRPGRSPMDDWRRTQWTP